MKNLSRRLSTTLLGVAALSMGALAHAQTSSTSSTSGSSWYAPSGGYIGINAGQSDFRQGCGTGLFSCDDKDDAYSVYGGSMLNNNFGLELGYVNMGDIGRAGGTTKAHGVNLSLVGKLPVSQTFGVFGKVGTTYGRTSVSAAPGSGVVSGKEDGFGLSVGAGVSFDFSERWSAVLQWDRHDFKFAGSGRDNINATTLGLKYRF